mmetsp:Transcript_57707/g.122771  ORF Transcript_57707/g.122771 Transcript_57707/m.122771 type:complete len:157 (-) Transcript_57707:123-593(-)
MCQQLNKLNSEARFMICALRSMLQMPRDDPRWDHLAAAAVLMGQGCCDARCYTAEMNVQIEDVLKLQEACLKVYEADDMQQLEGSDQRSVLEALALNAAFEQMREAVQHGRPLPEHEELLVLVARSLLKRDDFREPWQVAAEVNNMACGCGLTACH